MKLSRWTGSCGGTEGPIVLPAVRMKTTSALANIETIVLPAVEASYKTVYVIGRFEAYTRDMMGNM